MTKIGCLAIFVKQLDIPEPRCHWRAGWRAHKAEQTAQYHVRLKQELLAHPPPDLVPVGGDVTSTWLCALPPKTYIPSGALWKVALDLTTASMPEENKSLGKPMPLPITFSHLRNRQYSNLST